MATREQNERKFLHWVELADVRAFGLSWDDCSDFLAQLGYDVHVGITPLAV